MSSKSIIFLLLAIAVAAVGWYFFNEKVSMFNSESDASLNTAEVMDKGDDMTDVVDTDGSMGGEATSTDEMMDKEATSTDEMTEEEKAEMLKLEIEANLVGGGSATDPNEEPNAENTVPASN